MSDIVVRAATAEDCAMLAALIGELLVQHDLAVPADLAEALLAERGGEALGALNVRS